jgi:uncharacterized protein
METPAYSVDVRSILEDLGGVIALDAEAPIPVIVLGEQEFPPTRPAHIVASVTNTGAGIVASGTIDAEFNATCSRCLREFALSIVAPLEAFYVRPGEEHDLPEEQEIGLVQEGSIDLMEQMLAALVLELPFAPVHAEDCAGICPQCGADLGEGPCECEPDYSDSPFAALKSLLTPEDQG